MSLLLDPHILYQITYFARSKSVHCAFLYYKPYAILVRNRAQNTELYYRCKPYFFHNYGKEVIIYSPYQIRKENDEFLGRYDYTSLPTIKLHIKSCDDNIRSYLIFMQDEDMYDIAIGYNRWQKTDNFTCAEKNTLYYFWKWQEGEKMTQKTAKTQFIQHFIPDEFYDLRDAFLNLR